MASQYRLLIKNAKQLVTVCSNGERMKIGKQMDEVSIIENGAVVVDNNGNIVEVGSTTAIEQKYQSASFANIIDTSGKVVLPGLVDGHTHPVWSGDRVHEFAMKLAGATYMDIHKMGGGIGFTVNHTKQSSETELEELLMKRLWRMIKQGTTLIEAKSGYGLEAETELKMLKVLHKVQSKVPMDIVSNYLGGHSVPKGKSAAEATEDIINVQLPLVKKLNEAGEISATLIDVFCETGVFEVDDTRRILKAGIEHGLEINFHGDELTHIKASELAGELKALAISHVEKVSEEGIKALAIRPTVAVLLPTTAYILKLKPPPAKDLINNNVPVALGSDFNPNAHCVSMPFTMNLACVLMGMTMPQALNAATINAAASLNKNNTHGSLEAGKQGDMIVLDAPTWEHLVYQLVDPPIQYVIKKGNIIFEHTPTLCPLCDKGVLLVDHIQLGQKWYHKDCVNQYPEAFFIDDDELADDTPTAKLQFTPYDQKHNSNSNPKGFYTQDDNQSAGSYSSYAYKFDDEEDENNSDDPDAADLHADAYCQVTGDSDDEKLPEIKPNIPNITVSVAYANDNKPMYMDSGSSGYENVKGGSYMDESSDSSDEKSPSNSPKTTITPRNYHQNMNDAQNQNESEEASESDLVSTNNNSLNLKDTLHEWNKEYQQILSEMPYATIDQKIEKEHKICALVNEFKKVVDRVGRKIIDEIHTPSFAKTYKPLDAGGVAGGQKYVAENIFFKLCIDLNGIYGDDEYARKVSNMELIGLSAYLRCQQAVTPDLRLPFMALLDYRGYRLLAISVLPIGKDTLVYGSGDAGHTIKKDDPLVNEWMDKCAKYLNIKPHLVSKNKVLLSAAADIEVHKGFDGYYYILDTARALPPEQAVDQYTAIKILPKSKDGKVLVKLDVTKKDLKIIIGDDLQMRVLGEGSLFYEDKGELNPIASALAGFKVNGAAYLIYGSERRFLFYLLRPELVSQYKSPLSPDAFSGFGGHDENYRVHNAEVTEATNYLRHTVLTQFSEDLKSNKIYVTSRKELVREMHMHGINIRYLGLLRSLIHKVPRLQAITMLEMILRCIKNYVGRKFRKMKDNWKLIVVKYLNVFLGNSPQAKFYWTRLIKVQIEAKFGQYGPSLTSRELEAKADLSNIYPKHLLFLDLAEMLGIELDPRARCEVLSKSDFFDSQHPVTADMILGLKGYIKMPAFGDESLVKRLLKLKSREEFPMERVDQLKCEVKLMREFFGPKSAEQLKASIRLVKHLCSIERLDEALQLVTENLKEYSAMEKCNALLPVRLYLHLAEIQFKKEDVVNALFNIIRTMRLVCLGNRVTMKNVDHNTAIEFSFHPIFIAVLNYLMFIGHQTDSLPLFLNWIYIMCGFERMFPFPGTTMDFQKIFGYPHSFTPVTAVDFEGSEWLTKLQGNFKFGIHKTTLQRWYKKVFSMKDYMVYDVVPSLFDMEPIPIDKLFSFSSAQDPQIIHPNVVMRGQPFNIVAIIPPSNGGTNQAIVFYKDGSVWCEKMQKYEEIFTVLMGGFIHQCTVGKEFWDSCPLDTDKIGMSLRYSDTWGAQSYVYSSEMSIGAPDSMQMYYRAEKTFLPSDSREQALPLIQFHQTMCVVSPWKIERTLGIVSGWSNFQRNKHYSITENHKVLMFGNAVEYAPNANITSVPNPVEGLLGKEIVQIVGANAFGGDNMKQPFYAAVSKRGLLYTFGSNVDGALGLGFGGSIETNARLVQGLLTVKIARVEAGHSFMVALARDGKAFIWGQLGERELSSYPKLIHFTEGKGEDKIRIKQISAAGSRCTFLTEHGTFFLCGDLYPAPKRATEGVEFVWLKEYKHGSKKIKLAQCGVMHTVFVTEDDEVFCFGDNSLNQCVTEGMTWPHEHMEALKFVYAGKERKIKIKQLVGLNGSTALLTADGQVWLWGSASVYPRYQPVIDNYGNHIPVVAIGAEGRNTLGVYFRMPFNTNLPIDLPIIPEEQKFSHYDEDLALPADARIAQQKDMTTGEQLTQQQELIEKLQEENKDLKERLRVIEQFIKAPKRDEFTLDRY